MIPCGVECWFRTLSVAVGAPAAADAPCCCCCCCCCCCFWLLAPVFCQHAPVTASTPYHFCVALRPLLSCPCSFCATLCCCCMAFNPLAHCLDRLIWCDYWPSLCATLGCCCIAFIPLPLAHILSLGHCKMPIICLLLLAACPSGCCHAALLPRPLLQFACPSGLSLGNCSATWNASFVPFRLQPLLLLLPRRLLLLRQLLLPGITCGLPSASGEKKKGFAS